MRVIACSLWAHMVATQINILLTEVCQITWEVKGEKVEVVWCGQKDECVDGGEGAGQQCGRYSYRELSDGDCAKVCCPQMSIKTITKTLDMEECEGWYRARAARAVWLPILGVTLAVTMIVSVLFTFRYGYQTNPYNGERKWVGCCCCKKPPDFGIDHPPPDGKVQTDPMQVVPY